MKGQENEEVKNQRQWEGCCTHLLRVCMRIQASILNIYVFNVETFILNMKENHDVYILVITILGTKNKGVYFIKLADYNVITLIDNQCFHLHSQNENRLFF